MNDRSRYEKAEPWFRALVAVGPVMAVLGIASLALLAWSFL